jgi:hypothetical protein
VTACVRHPQRMAVTWTSEAWPRPSRPDGGAARVMQPVSGCCGSGEREPERVTHAAEEAPPAVLLSC